MLPTPSPRDTPPRRGVNPANVIKWMQALPASQRVSDLPARPDPAAPRRRAAPCADPAPVHPLPDPALARLCAVPESAPPYDDEPLAAAGPPVPVAHGPVTVANGGGTSSASGQQSGWAKPAGPEPGDPARPAGDAPDGQPPRATPPWPNQFARVLAETLAGARSSHQLTPWTTERARGHIRRLGPLLSASQQPTIRRVVASRPATGVVELTVVVNFGPRVRALAVRLEHAERGATGPSWLCTAIEAA
jgi:hypothetical protein